MDNKTEQLERVSALADGQLDGEAMALAVRAVCADAQARAAWEAYHLIGDVLRSADLAQATPAPRFLARLNERLAAERPQPLEVPTAAPVVAPAGVPAANGAMRPAANDGRWKLAAGFASFAAVAAIGWNLAGTGSPAQPQIAAAPAAVVPVSTASTGKMIRDPHLDRLLAAHRQLGNGSTALQQPAGFLRNATFEAPR